MARSSLTTTAIDLPQRVAWVIKTRSLRGRVFSLRFSQFRLGSLCCPKTGPRVYNCTGIIPPEQEDTMGRRDDLIAKYAEDLSKKCGVPPDLALLTKVTIGCGPTIYDADACTVAGSDAGELETVKKNFLIKKLGLADGPQLIDAIKAVIEVYGKSERNKYRAVVYYLLVKHFGKEAVYA